LPIIIDFLGIFEVNKAKKRKKNIPPLNKCSIGRRSQIQLRALLNKLGSAIECNFNSGAAFYTQRKQ
jgi:hypothetical protein